VRDKFASSAPQARGPPVVPARLGGPGPARHRNLRPCSPSSLTARGGSSDSVGVVGCVRFPRAPLYRNAPALTSFERRLAQRSLAECLPPPRQLAGPSRRPCLGPPRNPRAFGARGLGRRSCDPHFRHLLEGETAMQTRGLVGEHREPHVTESGSGPKDRKPHLESDPGPRHRRRETATVQRPAEGRERASAPQPCAEVAVRCRMVSGSKQTI
jgi:hypothetical protein